MSVTAQNIHNALAGEAMAHVKYRYFARIAREEGFEDIAKHFEQTAEQELQHAWSHLDLVVGKPSTKECLELAIEGETHEFTVMYPEYEDIAIKEGMISFAVSAKEQIAESKEHADQFTAFLKKAEKRFAALKRVEERHAKAYKAVLEAL